MIHCDSHLCVHPKHVFINVHHLGIHVCLVQIRRLPGLLHRRNYVRQAAAHFDVLNHHGTVTQISRDGSWVLLNGRAKGNEILFKLNHFKSDTIPNRAADQRLAAQDAARAGLRRAGAVMGDMAAVARDRLGNAAGVIGQQDISW